MSSNLPTKVQTTKMQIGQLENEKYLQTQGLNPISRHDFEILNFSFFMEKKGKGQHDNLFLNFDTLISLNFLYNPAQY